MNEFKQHEIGAELSAYFEKRGLFALNIKEYLYNHPDCSIFADDGNNIGILIVKYNNDKSDNMYLFDCLSPKLISRADDFIRSFDYIGFAGVEQSLSDLLKERYSAVVYWENPCDMYYYDEKVPPEMPQTDGRIGKIRTPDIKTVNDNYTYRHRGTRKTLLGDIKSRDNAAMFKDGEIASWVLLHPDNSLGVMFTLPEYRGKHYANALTVTLIERVIATGNLPYVHITVDNTASKALAASCKMKYSHKICWLGFGVSKEKATS